MFVQAVEKKEALQHMFTNLVDQKYRNRVMTDDEWFVIEYLSAALSPLKNCFGKQQTGVSQFWLLLDAINSIVSVYMIYANWHDTEETNNVIHCVSNNENDEMRHQLKNLGISVAQKIAETLLPLVLPLKEYMGHRAHVMLAVMLDPRFKSLLFIRTKLGLTKNRAQNVAESYDRNHLLPLIELLVGCERRLDDKTDTQSDSSDSSKGLFGKQTAQQRPVPVSCDDTVLEELGFFRAKRLSIPDKESVKNKTFNPLSWWKQHEKEFPSIALAARCILGIPGAQIECERLFSAAGIITRHRRNRTNAKTINDVMFVNYNLPTNDALGLSDKVDPLFGDNSLEDELYDLEEAITNNRISAN